MNFHPLTLNGPHAPTLFQGIGHPHGGGGHGGGGHGGGGHGGGVIYAGGGRGGGYYYPPPEVVVVETQQGCPSTWAPVRGSDGRLYRNACVAQRAGAIARRAATGAEMAKQAVLGRLGLGTISGGAAVAAAGVLLVLGALTYGAMARDYRHRVR